MGIAAAGAVAVEAAVALDDQAVGRARDPIQDEEVVADPAVGAGPVVVTLALAMTARGSADKQRKHEDSGSNRQGKEAQ